MEIRESSTPIVSWLYRQLFEGPASDDVRLYFLDRLIRWPGHATCKAAVWAILRCLRNLDDPNTDLSETADSWYNSLKDKRFVWAVLLDICRTVQRPEAGWGEISSDDWQSMSDIGQRIDHDLLAEMEENRLPGWKQLSRLFKMDEPRIKYDPFPADEDMLRACLAVDPGLTTLNQRLALIKQHIPEEKLPDEARELIIRFLLTEDDENEDVKIPEVIDNLPASFIPAAVKYLGFRDRDYSAFGYSHSHDFDLVSWRLMRLSSWLGRLWPQMPILDQWHSMARLGASGQPWIHALLPQFSLILEGYQPEPPEGWSEEGGIWEKLPEWFTYSFVNGAPYRERHSNYRSSRSAYGKHIWLQIDEMEARDAALVANLPPFLVGRLYAALHGNATGPIIQPSEPVDKAICHECRFALVDDFFSTWEGIRPRLLDGNLTPPAVASLTSYISHQGWDISPSVRKDIQSWLAATRANLAGYGNDTAQLVDRVTNWGINAGQNLLETQREQLAEAGYALSPDDLEQASDNWLPVNRLNRSKPIYEPAGFWVENPAWRDALLDDEYVNPRIVASFLASVAEFKAEEALTWLYQVIPPNLATSRRLLGDIKHVAWETGDLTATGRLARRFILTIPDPDPDPHTGVARFLNQHGGRVLFSEPAVWQIMTPADRRRSFYRRDCRFDAGDMDKVISMFPGDAEQEELAGTIAGPSTSHVICSLETEMRLVSQFLLLRFPIMRRSLERSLIGLTELEKSYRPQLIALLSD